MAAHALRRKDLNRLFGAAVAAAGPRYSRAANVEVPIADAFEALLRTPTFFARFDELARDVELRSRYLLDESQRFGELDARATLPRRIGLRAARLAGDLFTLEADRA